MRGKKMFNFRNKAFLYVAIATTCLISPAERLCAGNDETVVVLEQLVPGKPLPNQTFFVPAKGVKIAKNPLSISSLDTHTVTLSGVTKLRGLISKPNRPLMICLLSCLCGKMVPKKS